MLSGIMSSVPGEGKGKILKNGLMMAYSNH